MQGSGGEERYMYLGVLELLARASGPFLLAKLHSANNTVYTVRINSLLRTDNEKSLQETITDRERHTRDGLIRTKSGREEV